MELQHIPLGRLKVSPLNMRHARKATDISDLLPSIRARGVQQPILVRKNGRGYEIVAGRRRFFALKALAKEGAVVEDAPCAIMDDGDNAAALEASLIENTARPSQSGEGRAAVLMRFGACRNYRPARP